MQEVFGKNKNGPILGLTKESFGKQFQSFKYTRSGIAPSLTKASDGICVPWLLSLALETGL